MKNWKTIAFLLTITLSLMGCGEGSGYKSSSKPRGDLGNRGTPPASVEINTIELAELDKLSDAGSDKRLFYTQAEGDDVLHLMAVETNNISTPLEVDKGLSAYIVPGFDFLPIHTAEVDVNNRAISKLGIDSVFYLSATGFSDIKLNKANANLSEPVGPVQVSSNNDSELLAPPRRILQFDLENINNTRFAYSNGGTSEGAPTKWKTLSLGDDANTPVNEFDEDYQIVATLTASGNPQGWLVIDHDSNGKLIKVDLDGNKTADVVDESNQVVEKLLTADPLTGEQLSSEQFLVLTFEPENPGSEDDEILQGELWYFNGQSVKPVKNTKGEKLYFPLNLSGLLSAYTPGAEFVTQSGEDLFLFQQPLPFIESGAQLIRVNKNGWEKLLGDVLSIKDIFDLDPDGDDFEFKFNEELENRDLVIEDGGAIITVGDYLVWGDGEALKTWHIPSRKLTELDGYNRYNEPNKIPKYSTENVTLAVLGSANNWVFYNRTFTDLTNLYNPVTVNYAVAVKVNDPSSEINIANASWVGASSTGTSQNNFQFSGMELSEVFLLQEDGALGAVKASDPAKGLFPLGVLDDADEVSLYGLVTGPHRLLQAKKNGKYQVFYVNTAEKNSLTSLTEKGAQWNKPVDNF